MSKKGKKGDEKWKSEDVIQAVVIADSFNFRFLPITLDKPRALLPLVNRPLIDYTVEFLAVSGVDEIFVYCCAHADQLKAHLAKSRWNTPSSPVRLHTIIAENCPSVGDALRDIDSQALIRSDFVLVSGDLVANMELREVIEKHKQMRQKDKMTVMTNVYKKANPHHRTRSLEDDIFVATSSVDGRLVFCEKSGASKKCFSLPGNIFDEIAEVDISYDVLDCHISVCSPSVPQLFSDNFDYQTRYHFIRGIIVNEEILGHHIYTHFISDQYAARVCNLQTYDAISKDVIHRWVYPLVPDNSALTEAYSYGRRNIYLSTDVLLAFDSVLQEDVVVGPRTSVGAHTVITHSSIGRDCKIGKTVNIDGCYIWNNVVIGDNCSVKKAILCDGVVIKAGCVIAPGSILSFNVVIGEGFAVQQGVRLTTTACSMQGEDDWGEDEPEVEEKATTPASPTLRLDNPEHVGAGGKGFAWEPPSHDSDSDTSRIIMEDWHVRKEQSVDDEAVSFASSTESTPELAPIDGEGEYSMFFHEIVDYVRSGVTESVTTENTILMVNASKHAYNVPIDDVPLMIVKAIMEGPACAGPDRATELLQYLKESFQHHQQLLLHYVKDEAIQRACLKVIIELALNDDVVMVVFPKAVLELYNLDVIEESSILTWHKDFNSQPLMDKHREVLKRINPVIEWLHSAEEESTDSD